MLVRQRSACLLAWVQMRKERRQRVPSKHRLLANAIPLRENPKFLPPINTSPSAASRSSSASMQLKSAHESLTNGLDDLYLKRADWAAKERRSRTDIFNGRARPGDPVSASKTMQDLAQLVRSTSKTHR